MTHHFKHTSEFLGYEYQPFAVAMAHTQSQTNDKGLLWLDEVRSPGTERLKYLQWFKLTVQSPLTADVSVLNDFICALNEDKYRYYRQCRLEHILL